MIKLIIFDLDGVLFQSKQIHFESLNFALKEIDEKYVISESEHLSFYDGLNTIKKLELLSETKGLKKKFYNEIFNKKQKYTFELVSKIERNESLIEIIKSLKDTGYSLAVCSNSIRKTIDLILSNLGVFNLIDLIISNEDVDSPKPHPEMYWNAMKKFKVLPEETLIVEDSPIGLLAANRSNANIFKVDSPTDISLESLTQKLQNKIKFKNPKWESKNLTVLIPMAGAGLRFEKNGFKIPKPLININGKPLIQLVTENLNVEAKFIYIVQKNHREKYNLDLILNIITPNNKILEVDGLTDGAACSTLIAKDYINNDSNLLIANSDQLIEWNSNDFYYKISNQKIDGCILTFKSTHPKWSFAKIDEYGYVTEVAEKNPISDMATVGVYYWTKGSDYVKYAEQMIDKNIRVNNEFYVCPVYNQAILDGKKINTFHIEKMWGLGTPEDLEKYLKQNS